MRVVNKWWLYVWLETFQSINHSFIQLDPIHVSIPVRDIDWLKSSINWSATPFSVAHNSRFGLDPLNKVAGSIEICERNWSKSVDQFGKSNRSRPNYLFQIILSTQLDYLSHLGWARRFSNFFIDSIPRSTNISNLANLIFQFTPRYLPKNNF